VQLTGVECRDLKLATSLVLSEHFEKTAAAITLRKLHSE
jgi:hypothetical protein